MAIKGKWLNFAVIDDATKISVHVDFEISTLRPVIVTVAVITSCNDVRVVTYCLYEVDVSCWGKGDHQLISPCARSASSRALILCLACTIPVAIALISDCV